MTSHCDGATVALVSRALPANGAEALVWIQAALAARQYDIDPHFNLRLEQRRIPFRSVWYAVRNAVSCDPYAPDRPPLRGGNSWRVTGPDHEGTMTSVGVETYVDHLGRRTLLITVF